MLSGIKLSKSDSDATENMKSGGEVAKKFVKKVYSNTRLAQEKRKHFRIVLPAGNF